MDCGARFRRAVTLALLVFAAPARAAHWSAPEWNARLAAVAVSDLYPGYAATAADRGVEAAASASTQRRWTRGLKFEAGARLDAVWLASFEESRSGTAGLELALRGGRSQLVLEGEWSPRRVKFPDPVEDAAFARLEGGVSLRRALTPALRGRIEAKQRSDDYVARHDGRDATVRSIGAQVDAKTSKFLALKAAGGVQRTRTAAPKYAHRDHEVSGGISASPGNWKLTASVASSIARYTDAGPGDSNFRRRDQTLSLSAAIARRLHEGLELEAAAGFTDRLSSRLERSYTVHSLRLAVSWSRSAP